MKEEQPIKKSDNSYLRYSGLGFQLAGAVGLGAFIGYEIDKWQKTSGPYYTLGFTMLFLAAGFYMVFKDLMKK